MFVGVESLPRDPSSVVFMQPRPKGKNAHEKVWGAPSKVQVLLILVVPPHPLISIGEIACLKIGIQLKLQRGLEVWERNWVRIRKA